MGLVEGEPERKKPLMFAPYCPIHESRVLLFSDNIEAIRVEDDGMVLDYRCNCGYHGTWHASEKQSATAAV